MFEVVPWTRAPRYGVDPVCPVSPATVLSIDDEILRVVDVDCADPPPGMGGADAFVRTDRGFHLFWIKPSAPDPGFFETWGDQHYAACCAERGTELYYRSKRTGEKRRCCALTAEGVEVADAYNAVVEAAP